MNAYVIHGLDDWTGFWYIVARALLIVRDSSRGGLLVPKRECDEKMALERSWNLKGKVTQVGLDMYGTTIIVFSLRVQTCDDIIILWCRAMQCC